MHWADGIQVIRRVRERIKDGSQGRPISVNFVSPAMATLLAVEQTRCGDFNLNSHVQISEKSRSYAQNYGLLAHLAGAYEPASRPPAGARYSKLTRLLQSADVDGCNEILGDVIHNEIDPINAVIASEIARVIGELHDNVASHARGVGFSAAQVYQDSDGSHRLEFAVADGGCGLLSNVRKAAPLVMTNVDALKWCLTKGNTTGKVDDWAQRIPEDDQFNPYPPEIPTRSSANNHAGLGLSLLEELASLRQAELWLCTGDTSLTITSSGRTFGASTIPWMGFAIECVITVKPVAEYTSEEHSALEELAKGLGI